MSFTEETIHGWRVYRTRHPSTGKPHWVASRHGVSMNAHTKEALVSMVRQKALNATRRSTKR